MKEEHTMNIKKKIWIAVAIVISVIVAVIAAIWLLGGRLLWIRIILHSPLPDWLKSLLWGWGI